MLNVSQTNQIYSQLLQYQMEWEKSSLKGRVRVYLNSDQISEHLAEISRRLNGFLLEYQARAFVQKLLGFAHLCFQVQAVSIIQAHTVDQV
jgi:hypothetical protein